MIMTTGQTRVLRRAAARQLGKQQRIVEIAMRHFAADGYDGAHVDDIAREAGVAKGAVFGYFGSKSGLFLAVYKAAIGTLNAYLDAPPEVLEGGFFATLGYWLDHTAQLIEESWVPYRVTLLGNYCTDLQTRREITQYLAREDPYGTRAFVQFGIDRGEVRGDIDPKIIVSLLNWSVDGCQDAIVAEELDPGLFGIHAPLPAETREYVRQFVELLRSAIGER
ncbi:MAG: TetR/AcrR family transcriptional regulator [Acidimicrobiales bacterium]